MRYGSCVLSLGVWFDFVRGLGFCKIGARANLLGHAGTYWFGVNDLCFFEIGVCVSSSTCVQSVLAFRCLGFGS